MESGPPPVLTHAFELKLPGKVIGDLFTMGRFEGDAVSFVYATTEDSLVIYTPSKGAESDSKDGVPGEIKRLTVAEKITALSAVPFDALSRSESIKTSSSLLTHGFNNTINSSNHDPETGNEEMTYSRDVVVIGTGSRIQAYDVMANRDLFYVNVMVCL